MVAIRLPKPNTPAGRATERHPDLPDARRFVRSELPRSRRAERPSEPRPAGGLWARMARLMREHPRAVSAVAIGASALPMLTGMASAAEAAPVFARDLSPEARFEAFKAKAAEIQAKKGSVPYAEIAKQLDSLYREYARASASPGLSTDQDRDTLNLARETLFGTSDTKIDSDGDGLGDAYEVDKGLDPADPQKSGEAAVRGWTHGYIPMSRNPLIEEYSLLNYDLLIKDRTGSDPQTRYAEGASALENGHYFLSSTLDEKNAELTTGKDYNGDGVLTPGVKADFLEPGAGEADFGSDGKYESTLSVGWWGHCNDVAMAGITFREPKAAVTLPLSTPMTVYEVTTAHGSFKAESVKSNDTHTDLKLISGQTVRLAKADVTHIEKKEIKELSFSPTALKELASELVHRGSKDGSEFLGARFYGRPATIELKDGTTLRGGLTSALHDRAKTHDGGASVTATEFTKDVSARVFDSAKGEYTDRIFKPEELKSIHAENARDVNPIEFHNTMVKWIGSEKTAGVMDKDAGPHVWNYSFDRYEYDSKAREGDANTFDYEMKVYFSGNSYPSTYKYSITFEAGVPKSASWDDSSPNPDFFWRHRGGAEGYNHNGGEVPIEFKTVMELLKMSYAAEDGAATPAAPGTVAAPIATPVASSSTTP